MKNKKVLILITSLVLIILVAIIVFTQNNKPEKILSNNENTGDENLNDESAPGIHPADKVDISSTHRFIDNIEFGIGDSTEELVEKWGPPLEVDYIYGGLYLKYENVVFYTDSYLNDDKTYSNGTIVIIEANEAYGVKSGMTIEESRKVLGEPDAMGIFDELKDYGEGIIHSSDYYYRDHYTISIPYDKDTKEIHYISLGTFRRTPDIIGSGFLDLTDIEIDLYEDYVIDFDDNKLNGYTPMNIMKIWLHALREKNYEAEWELFTKEEKQLGWDKEYHMNLRVDQRVGDFDAYKNPINIEVNYGDNYEYAVISWEDKYLEEYDGFGNPFRFGFNLVNGGDRIWKVAFRPMQ